MRWTAGLIGLLVVGLGGCYAPNPQPGSPCAAGACPDPLVCSPATMTCEHMAVPPDAELPPDAVIVDGCTPAPEVCGDGVDQDCDGSDPSCAANDAPTGAIDVSAGGTFTGDLRYAHDGVAANGCGDDGGRDLFYAVTLTAPRVYYFDTFGSDFDTVLRVYDKPCAMVGTGGGALACVNDACGGAQSQLAVSLGSGESCIVVDQVSAATTTGSVHLRVIAGVRDGAPLPSGAQTLTGDTSTSSNIMDPSATNCDGPGANGKDLAYFFTRCPGQDLLLDAETCNAATWDTVLYVRNGNTTQIGCNDDACGAFESRVTNVPITNGVFYWLVIDGFDATASGAYTLTTNLR